MITKQQDFIRKLIREELNKAQIHNNFLKWFNGSKVVGNNGEPLIMFHGTSSEDDFDIFSGDRGVGWFTPNKKYAKNYIEDYGKILSVYLSIKNPYMLKISPENEMTLDEFIQLTGIKTNKKYYHRNYENEIRPVWDWYNPTYTNFLEQLDKNGYDGMKTVEYNKYDAWLPFYENQIKSVNNDGSWDINDNNIYS